VLAARLDAYDPSMLDMLCLAGEVGWARLSVPTLVPSTSPRLSGATPIALFLRENGPAWQALSPNVNADTELPPVARRVLDTLRSRGASFFNDLRSAAAIDPTELRQAIATLVAAGLAASDGFSGLRALIWASRGHMVARDRRAHFAGRWNALLAETATLPSHEAAVETHAWTLLRRYGVVFRRLLTREANAAPWRELTRVYRRLEARGEIRGGRFVAGMSGEQFALPEAVERLRQVRRARPDGGLVAMSAADPLNLVGIVTAGDRIRAARHSRMVYRDGIALAVVEGDCFRELSPIETAIAADVSRALSRKRVAALR
jgi:ATP-dependent helicase Lhr and Lhr-like helicase